MGITFSARFQGFTPVLSKNIMLSCILKHYYRLGNTNVAEVIIRNDADLDVENNDDLQYAIKQGDLIEHIKI